MASAATGVTASTTALSLSAPTVVYGDEQVEQFTATVSGAGGTPTGTVTLSAGTTTICTIVLSAGTGSCSPAPDQIPVSSVTMSAAYNGDATFAASSSPTAGLQVTSPPPVTPVATATSLELAEASVRYGDEQTEKLTVTVAASPGTSGPLPSGSVTVRSGTASACVISLSAGTGTCALRAETLTPGTARLTASYAGSAAFGDSVSATRSLAVAKEPTATVISLSSAKVTYGAEQHERITAAVRPAYGGIPTGHLTLKADGATLHVISLTSGKGSWTLPAARLAGGTARLTASYTDDAHYAGSTSATKKLTVDRASSKATLSLSETRVIYGIEQHERFSVTVRLAHGGTPAGRVTIKSGGAAICVITLKSVRGTCFPSATRLPAGRHEISALYTGNGNVIPSVSAVRSLVVARSPSRTGLSLSATQVRYGSEGSEKISVRVAPRYAGKPGGKVTVEADGTALGVISLKSGKGSYTLTGKRLAVGSYALVAAYGGNADFTGSISGRSSLKITSPPPPPPACHPRTSSGHCYEPGEYCPDRDHGLTGIAGDGEAIICEDNNGWRWEPLSNDVYYGVPSAVWGQDDQSRMSPAIPWVNVPGRTAR